MQSKSTEIREILLGNFDASGDMLHYENSNGAARMIWSMSIAIAGTRLFGPVKSTRVYNCSNGLKRVRKDCLKVFSDIGLLTRLEQAPDTLAVYVKAWYLEPVLLTADFDPNTFRLTINAYTRRVFFAKLSLAAILRKLEKEISGVDRVINKVVKEENQKKKKAARKEWKDNIKAKSEERKTQKKEKKEGKAK